MPSYSFGKRNRRRRFRSGGKRLSPLAIVGICALAAVLAALLIGNLLRWTLDEDALQKLTDGALEDLPNNGVAPRTVPYARAYPFAPGDPISSLSSGGTELPSALSIAINTPDGALTYRSPVGEFQGLSSTTKITLSNFMEELRVTVPYLIGSFHPQIAAIEDEDTLYAAALSDAALLREFACAGASEILLVGLPLNSDQLARSVAYLSQINSLLDGVHVGISVPLSVATSAESWELLPSLRQCADYLALDLRDASEETMEETLLTAHFYLTQHQMRLLLTEKQTAYITAAEATLNDFQILRLPKED